MATGNCKKASRSNQVRLAQFRSDFFGHITINLSSVVLLCSQQASLMDAFDAEQRSQWKLNIISVGLIKGQVWKTLPFTPMGKCSRHFFFSCSTPRSAMHLHHNRHHCVLYRECCSTQYAAAIDTQAWCLLVIGFMWTEKKILGVHKLYHRDSTNKYYCTLILRGKQSKALHMKTINSYIIYIHHLLWTKLSSMGCKFWLPKLSQGL